MLQTVSAAGVLSDVPANRAHLLTRRIGRIEEPVCRHRLRDLEIRHAWLDDDPGAVHIDLEYLVHSRERDDNAVGDGYRTAGEASARSAGDEGEIEAVAQADGLLHLPGRGRQNDNPWSDPVARQAIAFVGTELLGLLDDSARAKQSLRLEDELTYCHGDVSVSRPSAGRRVGLSSRRVELQPCRDGASSARLIDDVNGVVLPVGAGHTEKHAGPTKLAELSLPRKLPPEDQLAVEQLVIRAGPLKNAVDVHLERLTHRGGKRHAPDLSLHPAIVVAGGDRFGGG